MRAALRTPERSSLKPLWYLHYRWRTCTVPLGLAYKYNHTCITMSERGRCPDDWEPCNFDDHASCTGAKPVRVFWFWLRFHVYGHRSVMPSKPSCIVQPQKCLRLPFYRLWSVVSHPIRHECRGQASWKSLSDSKSKWKLKTQQLNTLLSMPWPFWHVKCTNDRYPSKCIATSLICHLGYLDKVGIVERTHYFMTILRWLRN
jgi:hypothetical protein